MTYPTLQRLLERSKATNAEQVLAWMKQHAPKQLARLQQHYAQEGSFPDDLSLCPPGCIMRGTHGGRNPTDHSMPPFRYTDPTNAPPRSAMNTNDFYRVIIDHANPDWPDRSQSVVGTTARWESSYGHQYLVIPPDDAVIGVVGSMDLWDTNVSHISDAFTTFCSTVRVVLEDYANKVPQQYNDFVDLSLKAAKPGRNGGMTRLSAESFDWWKGTLSTLKTLTLDMIAAIGDRSDGGPNTLLQDIVSECEGRGTDGILFKSRHAFARWIAASGTSADSLINDLSALCDFDKLHLKKSTPMTLNASDSEVWFSAPCVMIDRAGLVTLFKKLEHPGLIP